MMPPFLTFSLSGTTGLLLVSIGVLGLCVAGMAFNILFRKNGQFPETETGKNKNMRKLGITCVKQDELNRRNNPPQKNAEAAHCSDCTACTVSRIILPDS
ncbi:MAG: hypothetical protein LBN98_03165 [Prevotellaceae bacterium]|jgi:hypothetical protein|nr:hypothetical protein [Prevotellaceae bacterium]